MVYRNILLNLWCGILVVNLLANIFFGDAAAGLLVFEFVARNATLYLICNFFWLNFFVATKLWLEKIHPIFRYSWLGGNANLLPITKRYFSLVFVFLLMLNLPSLTCFEEHLFRNGTLGWYDGTIRSMLFGLAHFVIGCPVGMCLTQMLLGMWLTYCYLSPRTITLYGKTVLDGELYSTLNHTTFDLLACLALIFFLFQVHLNLEKKERDGQSAEDRTTP